MTDAERAQAHILWEKMMRHILKAGERNRYLWDHPDDPDFDAIAKLARKSERRFGEVAAEIAEWVEGPEWEPRVRVLCGKALAGLEERTE